MKLLLLGSGGREHALAWKLSQSKLCTQLFIAPGNAGTAQCGRNIPLALNDFEAICSFCTAEDIQLVIVGPEDPLVNGIVDFFEQHAAARHIPVIGPSAHGAQLEGSKSFAKAFMQRHGIPTAAYREFTGDRYEEGIEYLKQHSLPIVLKADGLAAGKGVLICNSHAEALAEFSAMIRNNKFGAAGSRAVVEEFLAGIELSVFVLTDGRHYVVLPEAKDYKRIGEADTGLNTGGMGAVSPVPFADEAFMKKVDGRVIRPTVEGLAKEGITYKGFIFLGLIKVGEDPFVIEYNCRLGDPETEAVIPRLKNDLVELLLAACAERLNEMTIVTDARAAGTVMAVSGGYPGNFEKDFEVSGLEQAASSESFIFHAATRRHNNRVVTSGGRVLCVTAYGHSIADAISRSAQVLQGIHFENMYYRRDIGFEFTE